MAKFTPRFNDDPSTKSTELNDSEVGENVGLTADDASGQQESPAPLSNTSGRKPLHRRYWFWLCLLGVLGGGTTIIITIWSSWQALERSLPDTADISAYVRDKTITIKAADGTILQQEGPATREQLKFEQVPHRLVQAFIASEDRRFYQHHGVDFQGIFRATLSNIHAKGVVEGASTITQQLARLVFLNQERTVWRKVREMALAQKIEQKLSKKQILERYLNLVYLGSGAYGVADASWVYFSKSIDQLSLPEMATIAGLAPAPSSYSPVVDPEAAKERRNLVLQRMHEDGYITAEQTAAATKAPLKIKPSPPKRLQVEAAYFTTYIQQELPKYVKPEVLEAGGLTVETTVNRTWQKSAEKAVKEAIADGRGENFKQAALVAIDPSNGEVRALVGGDDYSKNQFNHATQAQRQPGSTFKGFVYTTAIATGKSPYDSYEDAPFTVDGYEPKNFSEKFRGWIDMRDALTYSINMVAVKVLIDVGFEPTIKLAHQMGIKSTLGPTYSLALGGYEVNLLELTSAYGTLADQGLHAEVHGIRRITDHRGKVVYEAKYKPKRVLDKNSAAIMTWMLRNVVNEGTGRAAQLDRPVAGKTGTSDEARDLWFIGYVPQLVAGVWLGNDNNEPTWGHSGTAAYTWHEFMAKAIAGMPTKPFPNLPNLERRKGSIKAQPVRPKRIVFGKIDSEGHKIDPDQSASKENSDNSDQTSTGGSRRHDYQQPEPPRRRHYYSETSSEERPKRRHRTAESIPPTDAPPTQNPPRAEPSAPAASDPGSAAPAN